MKDWRGYIIVDRPGMRIVTGILQEGGTEIFGPYPYMQAMALFDRIDKVWADQFPRHKYSGLSLTKAG